MDLNGLPQNIADQLQDDIDRLNAKAQRLTIQAKNDRIMDLLPANAVLPIGYGGFWLDRAEGGWTAYEILTEPVTGIQQMVSAFRVNGNKVTLKTAWPTFVRWVDQITSTPDSSVQIADTELAQVDSA